MLLTQCSTEGAVQQQLFKHHQCMNERCLVEKHFLICPQQRIAETLHHEKHKVVRQIGSSLVK